MREFCLTRLSGITCLLSLIFGAEELDRLEEHYLSGIHKARKSELSTLSIFPPDPI